MGSSGLGAIEARAHTDTTARRLEKMAVNPILSDSLAQHALRGRFIFLIQERSPSHSVPCSEIPPMPKFGF